MHFHHNAVSTAGNCGSCHRSDQLCFAGSMAGINHNRQVRQFMQNGNGGKIQCVAGAGFKGACIALVDPAEEESIREKLTAEYLRRFPEYEGTFEVHFCKTDDGARFV